MCVIHIYIYIHIYTRICIQYILLYLHIYRAELQWFANTHPFQATDELWQRRCWDMGSELVYDDLTPEKFGQFAIATLTIPIISSGVCQWHHYHLHFSIWLDHLPIQKATTSQGRQGTERSSWMRNFLDFIRGSPGFVQVWSPWV